jgi:hypothetical protein
MVIIEASWVFLLTENTPNRFLMVPYPTLLLGDGVRMLLAETILANEHIVLPLMDTVHTAFTTYDTWVGQPWLREFKIDLMTVPLMPRRKCTTR